MRPYDLKNTEETCRLRRISFDCDDAWILTDGYTVSISQQKVGAPPTQSISLPRAQFNRLIQWYMRDQRETP